jgi:Na+-translocating ferredoxin:NAD+ oxidoreductase RNF subunit RnfB
MGGLGLLFGTILAVANKLLRVEEDPRIEQVTDMLPGSNCGACGSPGCAAFAELVVGGTGAPGGCTVASPDVVEAIADFLGVDAGGGPVRVARLHCAGGKGRVKQLAEYEGVPSCRSAHLVGGGGKACSWGCLGLADCEIACEFDAIVMNADGLPVVDIDKCTACGDCVDACPRNLFEILPVEHALLVQCAAPLSGDEARAVCAVACDACGKCAQDAAPGLVHMDNNLPVVDYTAGGPASPDAVARCPTGAIQWVPGAQFADSQLVQLRRSKYA